MSSLTHQPGSPGTETQEQGFTLIELSIVLVIIGLIVGGVLVGQDLIRAAEIGPRWGRSRSITPR
ncbi:MAG: prepilin-type N-terminal cleavage/methylation domain-containing protein [Rickettsiales bacterium]|nr:prepilin-type N-terminal cleavage/methylation domain-containing protein [Rickettsiales bacterium]